MKKLFVGALSLVLLAACGEDKKEEFDFDKELGELQKKGEAYCDCVTEKSVEECEGENKAIEELGTKIYRKAMDDLEDQNKEEYTKVVTKISDIEDIAYNCKNKE